MPIDEAEMSTSNISKPQNILDKAWIKDLPKLVKLMAQKWHLTELIEAENLTYNYVMFGRQRESLSF